jgi:hypothetical protein
MKYIVTKDMGTENIFLFPASMSHWDVTETLISASSNPIMSMNDFIVSGGHIQYEAHKDEPTEMFCTGKCDFGPPSRGDIDTALLMAAFNNLKATSWDDIAAEERAKDSTSAGTILPEDL